MRFWTRLLLVAALIAGIETMSLAEVGWSVAEYESRFGKGQRGYGKAPEIGFQVGSCRLVIEVDGDRSVAEIWHLGNVREGVPAEVLEAAASVAKEKIVDVVQFRARGALEAEIHEGVVNGTLVRVDVRNQMVNRVAFCGPPPSCGWIAWFLGRCVDEKAACPVLDRALRIDRKVDRIHEIAEKRSAGR
jgi:hypothetical protein